MAPRSADQALLRLEEGTVTRVADGDTVIVITPTHTQLRIRLFGIDAPETPKGDRFPGQPYGEEAAGFLKPLVEGKRVSVEIDAVDRDKRPLSTLVLVDTDVNLAMIEAVAQQWFEVPNPGIAIRCRTRRLKP